jgi:hypothetical protein
MMWLDMEDDMVENVAKNEVDDVACDVVVTSIVSPLGLK